MIKAILVLFLVACGSNANPATELDASIDGAPADSAGPPPVTGLTEVPIDCQTFTRETRHVSTDNSRDVLINRYAIVDGITRADRFVVTLCRTITTLEQPCSPADQCTGAAFPAVTQLCSSSTSTGDWYDGKLVLFCGTRTEHYNGAGVMTDSTQTDFTIKLEK